LNPICECDTEQRERKWDKSSQNREYRASVMKRFRCQDSTSNVTRHKMHSRNRALSRLIFRKSSVTLCDYCNKSEPSNGTSLFLFYSVLGWEYLSTVLINIFLAAKMPFYLSRRLSTKATKSSSTAWHAAQRARSLSTSCALPTRNWVNPRRMLTTLSRRVYGSLITTGSSGSCHGSSLLAISGRQFS
jgi:hypothetical protein